MTYEQALDALYAAEPRAFVAERERLARELRAEGRREDAKRLAKLGKPTAAAALLNALAREERRDVDLLLDAGHRLRQSQAGVLQGGERETFERARATERDALRRLVPAAQRRGASSSVLRQVEETLRTAAVSDEGRELLARGRFEAPLEPGGFELVPKVPRARRPRPPKQDAEARRAHERALREARSRVAKLEREAAAAAERVREAERALETARAELEKLKRAGRARPKR